MVSDRIFAGCLATVVVLAGAVLTPAYGAPRHAHASKTSVVPKTAVTVAPGTVVRWSAPGTTRCRMGKHSWSPIEETCYFPIDLETSPGVVTVARREGAHTEKASLRVERRDYGKEEIELPDIPQANPSPDDLKRNADERVILAKIFNKKELPAEFTLPLGKPANPLPDGKSFGVDRVFNGKPAEQPHMGNDYPVPMNTEVHAVADGTVVLAQDLFYPGNAVIIDHGDGLFTMYFHLSEFKVTAGQSVKKGDAVGLVGSTGRATGPHLFFGVRWHDARINPAFLFDDPAKMPAL